MAATKLDETDNNETEDINLNWQQNRAEVRKNSAKGTYVRSSLQSLNNEDVICRLQSIIETAKDKHSLSSKARGMRAVQEHLMFGCGYIDFNEAHHIYTSFSEFSCTDNQSFRDKLLDPIHGLPVYIITNPVTKNIFVVLKKTEHLEHFFSDFTDSMEGQLNFENESQDILDRETLTVLINTMDSEYDKNVLRTVLALFHSRSELSELGIDPATAKRRVENMVEVAKECENAFAAGEDMVRLNLLSKKEKTKSTLLELNNLLEKKRDVWPEKRVKDLEESKERYKERLHYVETLLEKEDKSAVEKVRRAAKRKAAQLIEDNRIKRRKLGAQRPKEMDEDEEQYLLKAIDEMSTTHGRRHDTVLYLHHRVKSRDMLRIVNHRREMKGKRPLKAVSTVLARGKPKRISSIQSKRHLGQSLFCCKKPPKTEDSETELTHHQRAHVKNAVEHFCYDLDDRKHTVIKSMDDKAYVRPGTSVGFRDVKKSGIFQPSDPQAARQLPKYDWVVKEVYVTPATHRVFTKEPRVVGEKQAYVMSEDDSFVFMRPKAQVGSSGTVWSSEDYEIRSDRPDLYEVSGSGSSYSMTFRGFCSMVQAKINHFIVSTTEEDITSISKDKDCSFRSFEEKRILNATEYLERAGAKCDLMKLSDFEVQQSAKIQETIFCVSSSMKSVLRSAHIGAQLWEDYQSILQECKTLLSKIGDLNLPKCKSRLLELTDAGPGVGCNNSAVQYRMAETILIHGLDHVVRVHRARGDSGQNEAERTNASIGDALVTGETLQWEFHKRFEGMSEEEIEQLSLPEYEKLEEERMRKNAWRVAEELAERVDGEPAPNGFIKCKVTQKENERFLWDSEYLEKYSSVKSESGKEVIPGHGYYKKLEEFIELHFQIGELYIEYLKGDCESKSDLCNFCQLWNGPKCGHVPRPFPDREKPGYHYLAARNTPLKNNEGENRPIDDFQPRAQLKHLFENNAISSADEDSVTEFSTKYIVPENLTRKYILHLEHLELLKEKRQRQRKAEKQARMNKAYTDYDWESLYKSHKLSTLRLAELDKYIKHHSLTERATKMKKNDKVSLVEAHIAMSQFVQSEDSPEKDEDEDLDDDDDNDVVYKEWGDSSVEEEENSELFCICRGVEDERFMICCDKCQDWFHGECINMSENEMQAYEFDPDLEFICPFCIVT